MRKYSFLIIGALSILFASCSKETLNISAEQIENSIQERSSTVEIEGSVSSTSVGGGFLTIDFSILPNLSIDDIIAVQTISFSDSGGSSAIDFLVITWEIVEGQLSIVFDQGGNDLTGFEIDDTQSIIIVDGDFE